MTRQDAAQHMFNEGQRKWPRVELPEQADLPCEAADLYVCCACAEAQSAALRAIESEDAGVAKAAIARMHREADFAYGTLQEVWDKLLSGSDAMVRRFAGRGRLKAWVRVTASRAELDGYLACRRHVGRHVELSEPLAAQHADFATQNGPQA